MEMPAIKWEINLSALMNLAIMLATILIGYGEFTNKFNSNAEAVQRISQQTTRMEHYLSSQDQSYWQKVAANGDYGR